ncbi:MAG: class IV adenylate cyclase [Nanoarchaeota archaeon]
MNEIELKVLDINIETTVDKLYGLGAQKTFAGEVQIVTFDFPKPLDKKGRILRVRKMGDSVELCFKGKVDETQQKVKVREEIEVTTNSFENTINLFEALGFQVSYEGKKYRESYILGKAKFDIDVVPNLPPFLEIEAPTKEEVVGYVTKLGFTMKQTSILSARQLEKYYQEKK